MKSVSEGMSEKEMRKHLAERGMTQQDIDAAIDRAKKEPPR
jgi:SOS response regulatory protein OraA/RecX